MSYEPYLSLFYGQATWYADHEYVIDGYLSQADSISGGVVSDGDLGFIPQAGFHFLGAPLSISRSPWVEL